METIKKIIEEIEKLRKEESDRFNYYCCQKEDDNTQEFRDRQIIKYSHSAVILDRLKELIEKEFDI